MTDTNQDTSPVATTTQSIESHTKQAPDGLFSKESMMNFLPIILIFGVFYFFIIRPQVKKQKDQVALVNSAKKGDKVIVAGGIVGKIIKEKESNILILEVSKDVQIEVLKSSILSIVQDKPATREAENQMKKKISKKKK